MIQKITAFFKSDIVLSISACLALLSCFLSPPGIHYFDYIDFHTLILLFCLMLIVEGLRREHFFLYTGNLILSRVRTTRSLVATLIFLCFISSMFITNDVALITFVPFGIMILEAAGMTSSLCLTVTLMTVAANLGSMFTPIGNPQNLYLYSLSGMDLHHFLILMLPYTLLAAVLLLLFILFGYKQERSAITIRRSDPINSRLVVFYGVLFLLCILTVAGTIPHIILFILVCICILYKNRLLFCKVDYQLLITFIFFFIFVGNIRHLDRLHQFILQILDGRECGVSVGISQIISNVPAAMLLSNYTSNIQELIIGTNLGGLGTLIASMASLISYRQISAKYPQTKKMYLLLFTCINVVFLLVLCVLHILL